MYVVAKCGTVHPSWTGATGLGRLPMRLAGPMSQSLADRFQPRAMLAFVFLLALVATFGCTTAPRVAIPTPVPAQVGDEKVRPVDGARMVFVPTGQFTMGSDRYMARYAERLCEASSGALAVATCQPAAFRDEQPAHTVSLDAFWLDRTEVTNSQYQRCVEAGACDPPALSSSFSRPKYFGEPAFAAYPVVNLTWQMASKYCAWAGARLPTEAEWEYAARGPENRIFAWGNDFDRTKLNYCDASCPLLSDKTYDDGYPDSAPVGSFPAGASWVHALDLTGNVREWVADWLGKYPSESSANPAGPASGDLKITRGGAWYDTPDDVRAANRGGESLEYYRDNLGFRCALEFE